MTKKALTKKPLSNTLVSPSFMQDETHGLDDLGTYIIPPRLKVVQRQSSTELLSLFNPGTLIAVPQMVEVSGMEDSMTGLPFFFTPLFFFAEWLAWNPIEMKGVLNSIRERTLDPESALAAKARNPRLWREVCPESKDHKIRNCEHLNLVVLLLGDNVLAGTPMVISFSRSEHKCGSKLLSLIKMRKAPIFGCQFMGVVGHRANNKGEWFGVDVVNPAGDSNITPFVQDEETYKRLKALHLELKEAHEKMQIRVDYDEDPVVAPGDSDDF